MTTKLSAVALFAIVAFCPVGQVFGALVAFNDDFEGPTLDPFWTISAISGSVTFPSTARAHSGNQSVQFNSTNTGLDKHIQIYHDFDTPTYGTFSVWLYDTGADLLSSNYLSMYLINTTQGKSAGLVTFDYDLGPTNGGEYYYNTFGGAAGHAIDRSQGWHQFTMTVLPTSTVYKVDGQTIHTEAIGLPVDRIMLYMFAPNWRPAWVGYYDDFSFQANAAPEPSSLISAALGLLGLAGYAGWRRVRPAKPAR